MGNSTEATNPATPSPAKRSRGKEAQDGESPAKKTKKNGKLETPVKNGDIKDEEDDIKTDEKPMKMEDTDTA